MKRGPFCPHCDTPIRFDQVVCTGAECIRKQTEITARMAADIEANPYKPRRDVDADEEAGTRRASVSGAVSRSAVSTRRP